jgi:ribonuclease HI
MKSLQEGLTVIFTDGASSGNPGPGGWGAIIVTPSGEVTELGGREVPTTNNRMELLSTIQALRFLSGQKLPGPVAVYTDSTYVIRGITQWIWGWRKKGWISSDGKPVAHSELWQNLFQLVSQKQIDWRYVRGHSGVPGNERADEIAVAFSKGAYIPLFRDKLLKYSIPIFDVPENTELPEPKPERSKAKEQPYSYLSLIGGKLMRHASWAECERRVKGQSGAKFKKAMSPVDEIQILQSWGVKADEIANDGDEN